MNRKQHSVVLAGLLALALAGCSSMRGGSDMGSGSTGSGTGSSGSSGSSGSMGSGSGGMDSGSSGSSGSSGTSGTSGSMGSGSGSGSMGSSGGSSGGSSTGEGYSSGGMTGSGSTASPQSSQMPPGAGGATGSQASMPNAVVTVIEVMPHSSDGAASVGGSGTAGTTDSSAAGSEKMYRITLRMDDGTTRVVTQDKAPSFRNGDRVNMTDGMITQ